MSDSIETDRASMAFLPLSRQFLTLRTRTKIHRGAPINQHRILCGWLIATFGRACRLLTASPPPVEAVRPLSPEIDGRCLSARAEAALGPAVAFDRSGEMGLGLMTGNKHCSSGSLRPWIAARVAGLVRGPGSVPRPPF